jgi:Tfp pilus assembly protein PilN
MLEINLLPGGGRKKLAAGPSVDFNAMFEGLRGRMGDMWSVGAIAAIVIALGTGGYLYWRQGHDRTVAETRLQKAQEDSARFSKVVAQRNAAQARRDTLLRQVNLIKAIDDDRYIWPHIMDEVSKALPVYTWITIMGYGGTPQGSTNIVATPAPPANPKAKAGADTAKIKKAPVIETVPPRDQVMLRITGRTVDVQAMTRFISQLEDSPFLSNVYLERSTPSSEAGSDYYQFQLIINYTRPDSLAIRRLPLLTAGRTATATGGR